MQRERSNAIAVSNDYFNVFSKKFNNADQCIMGLEDRQGLVDYVQQIRLDNIHKSYQEGSIADFIFSGVKYIKQGEQKSFNNLHNELYDITKKARTLQRKFVEARKVELEQLKRGLEEMMKSDKLVVVPNQAFKLSASHFQTRDKSGIETKCKNDIKVVNTEMKALDELMQGKISRAMEFFSAKQAGLFGATVDKLEDLSVVQYGKAVVKVGKSLYTIGKTVKGIATSLNPISLLTACFTGMYGICSLVKKQNELMKQAKQSTCQCGKCQNLVKTMFDMIDDKAILLVFQTFLPPLAKVYEAGKTIVDTVKKEKGKEFSLATQLRESASVSLCPVAVLLIVFLLEDKKKADQVLFIRTVAAIAAKDGHNCIAKAIKSKTGG